MNITLSESKNIDSGKILDLYRQLNWSSAEKPEKLINALQNSHSLVSAWDGDQLVGLGNALSDGFLVAYYAHLLVSPAYQGQGIGRMIVDKLQEKYGNFHQQVLVADGRAIDFYEKCGFEKAGSCLPMWIYQGHDHD